MREKHLHTIEECLSEDWIDSWAGEGVRQVEEYLAKHAAFKAFLDRDD